MKSATTMNPFFEVSRNPIFTKVDGREIRLAKDVLINNDTGLPIGIVSKNFNVITNKEVNDAFGEIYSKYKIKKTMDFMKKGGEVWVRRIVFEDDMFTFDVGNGDSQHIMLEISNGFNTTTRVSYNISLFRSICENGMVFGRKNLFGLNFTHMRNNLEVIQNTFELGTKEIGENIIPTWQKWNQIPFTMENMVEYLDTKEYINNEKMKERILIKYDEIMTREKHSETLFGAFNTLTYMMTHETDSRREDTSNIFSNAYKKYERLANEMYELPM